MARWTAILACLVDGALGLATVCGEQATLGLSIGLGYAAMSLHAGFRQ